MSDYAGRRAVITGGTHGMGLATARALIDVGAEVLVTGANEANLEAARRALGSRAQVVRSDVTSMPDIDALGALAERSFGRIDLLHVNAGFARLEPFASVTEASYDKQFAVNAKGAYFTVQRLAPLIREGGAVVFTSSVVDEGGSAGMSVYAGAKAALRSFASGFAAELMPRGIRVNVVSPGFIRNPTMGAVEMSPAERAAFERLRDAVTPMRRHGTAEEVARAVLFLGFEATFTTGVRLAVDGGLGQRLTPPQGEAA